MSTSVTNLTIKAADRKDYFIRAELWRTVNAVGRWLVTLDNTGQRYGATGFEFQDRHRHYSHGGKDRRPWRYLQGG